MLSRLGHTDARDTHCSRCKSHTRSSVEDPAAYKCPGPHSHWHIETEEHHIYITVINIYSHSLHWQMVIEGYRIHIIIITHPTICTGATRLTYPHLHATLSAHIPSPLPHTTQHINAGCHVLPAARRLTPCRLLPPPAVQQTPRLPAVLHWQHHRWNQHSLRHWHWHLY